jgi:hypothetical protein
MTITHKIRVSSPVIEALEPRIVRSTIFYVSTQGNDLNAGTDVIHAWRHIQKAFDSATPGSTVFVEPGKYNEKLTLHVSGTADAGPITFQADGPLGSVVISGRNKRGHHLIDIANQSYVIISGFDLRDDLGVRDGSGIRIEGSASNIQVLGNRIHRIKGSDAMGITVYGTDPVEGIHDLNIAGNEVYDCQPAHSEALTLNGNVYNFSVTGNTVHDVNNIGICFIGHEGTSPDAATDQARDGICSGNRVYKARSSYGDGYAAGIYVDGGRDIVVERNVVSESNLGLEVGCEHAGQTASGITVRDNVLFDNDKAGLAFGGYDVSVGRVLDCQFLNNTFYHNDQKRKGNGELWVQWASGNTIANNLIVANRQGLLVDAEIGSVGNTSDDNLFFVDQRPGNAHFVWHGAEYDDYATYRSASGQDAASRLTDPLLVAAAKSDFHLSANSPAINAGDPSFVPGIGELDIDGQERVAGGRVDIGADEVM